MYIYDIAQAAQPIVDLFFEVVCACCRKPPFKPVIKIAATPGSIRYEHKNKAIVLIPYELLSPAARAGMDRYAAIGTLGLSGREQYQEIFHSLLVPHELSHWLQELAARALTRWEAEYRANQIMVAFWREFPAPAPSVPTEMRLANFVVQPPSFPKLLPEGTDVPLEIYFNRNIAEIENDPPRYAGFQKFMVRQILSEHPRLSFRELVNRTWPD